MSLNLEEKKELSQLSGYFKKLEITTNHLGMELDDLISEYRDNGYAHDTENEKSDQSSKRKETFQKAAKKPSEKIKTAKH
jgi:hypothetical protein